jgi:putative transposase
VGWLRKQLETADVDLLREMVGAFAETLMSAEADALCGAPYGERSEATRPHSLVRFLWRRAATRKGGVDAGLSDRTSTRNVAE